ncbi:MAG: hypothetical protein M1826_002889 [Phylliscum demangeonii]|nr:MAG: hypothetical protein M1826_002889 [Phylliscum demangeonii]
MAPSSVSKAKSGPKKPASKAPVKVTKATPKTTPTKTMPKVTPSKTIRATPTKSKTTPAKALTLATPVKKLNVAKPAKARTAKSATKVSAPTEEIESAAVKMWRNQGLRAAAMTSTTELEGQRKTFRKEDQDLQRLRSQLRAAEPEIASGPRGTWSGYAKLVSILRAKDRMHTLYSRSKETACEYVRGHIYLKGPVWDFGDLCQGKLLEVGLRRGMRPLSVRAIHQAPLQVVKAIRSDAACAAVNDGGGDVAAATTTTSAASVAAATARTHQLSLDSDNIYTSVVTAKGPVGKERRAAKGGPDRAYRSTRRHHDVEAIDSENSNDSVRGESGKEDAARKDGNDDVGHFRLPSAKAQCRLELCDESAGTTAIINLIAADVYHTEAAADAAELAVPLLSRQRSKAIPAKPSPIQVPTMNDAGMEGVVAADLSPSRLRKRWRNKPQLLNVADKKEHKNRGIWGFKSRTSSESSIPTPTSLAPSTGSLAGRGCQQERPQGC